MNEETSTSQNEASRSNSKNSHDSSSQPEQIKLASVTYKLVVIISLIASYITLGAWIYPTWWYIAFFEGKWSNFTFWWGGIEWFTRYYGVDILLHLVTIIVIIWFSHTQLPDSLNQAVLRIKTGRLSIKKLTLLVAGTLLLATASIYVTEVRTRDWRIEREIQRQELENNLEATRQQIQPLLSQPTKFIYLQRETIDSLYGQYEPDLIPAVITVEMRDSKEIKGGLSIDNFLKTDYGRQIYNSKVEQYQKITKNTERKLRDIITYFAEKNPNMIFQQFSPGTKDLKQLEDATQLLAGKYDIVLDQKKLQQIRDTLMTGEIRYMERRLQDIHGLVFVEGKWLIEVRSDAYIILKKPFIESVSTSPICEVKLAKDALSPSDREILETASNRRIPFAVFGNALSGISNNSKTILLSPIAVY